MRIYYICECVEWSVEELNKGKKEVIRNVRIVDVYGNSKETTI